MTKRKRARKNLRRPQRASAQPVLQRVQAALDVLLHPRETERPWKYLPLVLGLAFAARAVVALSGDFVVHPDEIMQYLEPAHRLVFGNGVTYWEYFYGARSWLVPGIVAGVLLLFDAVGLGQPSWYVGGVKLLFCAISLAIPAGMYFFARRHFGETAGRAALLAGAFWYELVGFAHKPMTEFLATATLAARLAALGEGWRRLAGVAAAGFTTVSLAGTLNALPYQDGVYRAWSKETGAVGFARNQDPIFPAYRYLARSPGVSGVWQVDRRYFYLPAYYYLHRKLPFYDAHTGSSLKRNVEEVSSRVSHIVSADPGYSVPGYSLEQEFGEVRVLRRDDNELPVRTWIDHAPIILSDRSQRIMRRINSDARSQPANFGIQFADWERP